MPSKQHQLKFADVCESFYFSKDPLAEQVLLAVEQAEYNADTAQTTVKIEESKLTPELIQLLKGVGIVNGVLEYPEDLGRYNAIKNNMRRQFHDQTEQNLNDELENSISRRQSQIRISGSMSDRFEGSTTDTNATDGASLDITDRVKQLSKFINKHKMNIGSHPFLLGLHECLSKQRGKLVLLRWRFEDAVLTQAGVPFMNDAVELLLESLLFTSDSKDMPTKGNRDWYMCPWLSDRGLTLLMGIIPHSNQLEGRPTGELVETDRGRICTDEDESMAHSLSEDMHTRLVYVKSTIFGCFGYPIRSCCWR